MRKIIGKIYLGLNRFFWNCVYESFRSQYTISKSFKFNGNGISFYGDGEIIIGDNSYIGRYSSIQSSKGCFVKIGRNCSISHYVMIYTENSIASQDISNSDRKKVTGNVVIGNNCWIGARVFIKEGVKVGNNCVIGANSVVTADIPDFCIYGGVPARLIKRIDPAVT